MDPNTFTNPPADACTPAAPGAFGPDRITRSLYDAAGRLAQSQAGVGTALLQTTATYGYTANGQVAALTDARGFRTSAAYDGFDRLIRRSYPDPSVPNQSSTTDYEDLAYDAAGRVSAERRRSGEYFYFGYDNLDRTILRDAPGSQPDVRMRYCARHRPPTSPAFAAC